MSHRAKYESLMEQHVGRAAIGHVRYATCGAEDRGYAQPLERPHIQKRKWFAFGFNGQLANYPDLRAKLLADNDNHLARDNDTEMIMHAIGHELSGDSDPDPIDMLAAISKRFDGMEYRNARCLWTIDRRARSSRNQADGVRQAWATGGCRERERGTFES